MNPLAVVDVEADDAELGNSEQWLHGSHLPKLNKLSKRPPLVERRHTCDARRRHVDRHESRTLDKHTDGAGPLVNRFWL